jgi:hypothetical protein
MTPTPVPFFATPAPKQAAKASPRQPLTLDGWLVAKLAPPKKGARPAPIPRAAREAAVRDLGRVPAGVQDAGDPAVAARAIVGDPIFRHRPHATGPVQKSLWETFWDFVGEQLDRLFRALFGKGKITRDAGSIVAFAVAVLAIGVLLALVARIVNTAMTQRRIAPLAVEDAGRDPARLLADADAAAAHGDFAGATIRAFVAGLLRLDRAGVVAYDATRTPNEYRRMVRSARPAAAEPFDALARAFVPAAYGDRPLDAMHYATARGAYDALARTV